VFDPFALISPELGFFIQMDSSGQKALVAFDLESGATRWRYPLARSNWTSAGLFTDAGNILLANKTSLLEISTEGQLVRETPLRTPLYGYSGPWGPLLLRGRWFVQMLGTVFAYDLPGSLGEGRLGWNSRHGNAQGENRPREE